MENNYAAALWKSIASGTEPQKAVHALVEILQRHGRRELLPHVLKAFKRQAARELKKTRTQLYVAQKDDIARAMKASGSKNVDVCFDETLIGGWRLQSGEKLVDASFKRYLLDIYKKATA